MANLDLAVGYGAAPQVGVWHARILQREVDHLDGTLYTDRMLRWTLCERSVFTERYANLPTAAAIQALELPSTVG